MRVGIIGAGLSGLAAARDLIGLGYEVVVIEKSRGVGGRLAARRIEGTVVDHGAPLIECVPGSALHGLVHSLARDDVVWMSASTVAYRSGATRLAKLMAEGVEVLLGVRITALRAARAGFELGGEQGNTHGVVDAVVISAPAPQAADLLEQSPEAGTRVTALRAAVYDPAVMILAGMRIRTPSSLEPFAVETPFARITAESARGREPIDGVMPVVARIAPGRSADLFDAADGDILADLAPRLSALCGAVGEPAWTQVKRWRYATLPVRLDPEVVNPPASRIVVCGDTIAGGGLEDVFASGRAAALAVHRALSMAPKHSETLGNGAASRTTS